MEGGMKQGRFSEIGMSRPRKQTRRAMFLDQMTAVVPWDRFEQLIVPHYPVACRGRRRKLSLGRPKAADAREVAAWRKANGASIKQTCQQFGLSKATVARYCSSA